MTWPGIEPRSPWPLANTLPTGPMSQFTLGSSLISMHTRFCSFTSSCLDMFRGQTNKLFLITDIDYDIFKIYSCYSGRFYFIKYIRSTLDNLAMHLEQINKLFLIINIDLWSLRTDMKDQSIRWLVGWILWYKNLCRLFNAKSIF